VCSTSFLSTCIVLASLGAPGQWSCPTVPSLAEHDGAQQPTEPALQPREAAEDEFPGIQYVDNRRDTITAGADWSRAEFRRAQ